MKTSRYFLTFILLIFSILLFSRCDEEDNTTATGEVSLFLTDAPINSNNVESVILSIDRIQVRSSARGWISLQEFEEPVTVDLLAYQNGDSFFLTEELLPAGEYDEIRLVLNMAPEETYILYKDGQTQELKVPSGSQSGFKVKGDFNVPPGGVVNLTIDWDLRRSIVEAGNSGQFILKPVTRLIANDDAGLIEGTVDDNIGLQNIIVYAYSDNTFAETELNNDFTNAITSASVNENNEFTLAFLSSGIYDLYFVEYDSETGAFLQVIAEEQDVNVSPGALENLQIIFNN